MIIEIMTEEEILNTLQSVHYASSKDCVPELIRALITEDVIKRFNKHQLYLLGLGFYKLSFDSKYNSEEYLEYKQILVNSAIICFDAAKEKKCNKASYYLNFLHFNGIDIHKTISAKYKEYSLQWQHENIDYGNIQRLKGIGDSQGQGHSPASFACKSKIARQLINMAQKGISPAQIQLAEIYLAGKGVPESPIHAYIWAEIARINGQPKAIEISNLAKSKIIEKEEIIQADAKAADMLEANPELYEDLP